jgi:hypothetical protein
VPLFQALTRVILHCGLLCVTTLLLISYLLGGILESLFSSQFMHTGFISCHVVERNYRTIKKTSILSTVITVQWLLYNMSELGDQDVILPNSSLVSYVVVVNKGQS